MRGQAFDLLDVEKRVAFHKRDFALGVLAFLVGFGPGDAVRVNDKGAVFPLANMGFKLKGLLERHPDGRGVAFRHGLAPEQKNIHAPVGRSVVAQWPRNLPRRVFGAPWFHPGADALLKVRNDAVCHAGVNVLAVKAAFGVFVFGCHWFFPPWKWVAWRACNPAPWRKRG